MANNMRNDKQIAGVFNECFESMLIQNASIDECIARYPHHAAELKPLLETTKAAKVASSISPDTTFRARAGYEFRSALYDKMSRKERPALAWRWATIASTVGVFLLTSMGGVVAASSGSMPGQTLYQVKRTIENIQVTMTPSHAAKARLYATLADRRVSEIVYAADPKRSDVKLIEDLTQQFMSDLSMVSIIAAPTRALTFGDGPKQAGAPSVDTSAAEQSNTTSNSVGATNDATSSSFAAPPTAIAPALTSSTIASAPPQVSITQAAPIPNSTFILLQPQISPSGITNQTLLKLLQQSSAKNIAELMSILDNVSPSVKVALLTAIQAATTGYGQILGE
jgi:hypothetical protein